MLRYCSRDVSIPMWTVSEGKQPMCLQVVGIELSLARVLQDKYRNSGTESGWIPHRRGSNELRARSSNHTQHRKAALQDCAPSSVL
jgi:hypothetical protein